MSQNLSFASDAPGVSIASKSIGVSNIDESPRYRSLDWLQANYDCTQHDGKMFDFDGRVINAGPVNQQQFISEKASTFIPLRLRRPSSPVRMAKMIVDAFTALVFGDNKFPAIKVHGDAESEDFKEALIKDGDLALKFVQARNYGGSMGTVGISWRYKDGLPRNRVQNAKNLWVQEWVDRDQLIPAWVTQIYKDSVDEWNFTTRRYEKNVYWYRRDWTLDEEVIFSPIPYEGKKEPDWLQYLDQTKTIRHNDGICHLVWVQNFPSEDIDGVSDFAGQLEACEALDMLNSVLFRGTTLNLDPTVLLKMDPELLKISGGIHMGSDNALVVGTDGNASYMELTGSAAEVGLKLQTQQRQNILDATQCVIPNPDQVAAGSVSAVALKTIYRPMIARGGVLRTQYGEALRRLLTQQSIVARIRSKETVSISSAIGGQEEQVIPFVTLTPRADETPIIGDDGKKTGEVSIEFKERVPGEIDAIDLKWSEWFPPTPADIAQSATTLQLATGGKCFISKQSAVEKFAGDIGLDPDEEWNRVSGDAELQAAKEKEQAGMFGADDNNASPVDDAQPGDSEDEAEPKPETGE